MIHFKNKIVIERPVDEVFEFVSNFENIPKWNTYVKSVNNLTGDKVEQGSVFRQVRVADQQDYQVVAFVPERRVAIQTLPGSEPEFWIECRFNGDDQRTEFSCIWDLELGNPLLPPIFDELAANKIKDEVYQDLTRLKRLLEAGRVTLQDGRISTYQS